MLKFINHYIILFFLLSAPLGALAQDWALFPEGHKGYYRGWFGTSPVGVLIADSIERKGDTTITRLNFNQPIYASECKTRILRNDFLKPELAEVFEQIGFASTDFLPIVDIGDTTYTGGFRIARKANAGESWNADSATTCRVDSVVWRDLGGIEDSVKFISVIGPEDSTLMRLSKNHGLVEFRGDRMDFLLAGDRENLGAKNPFILIGGKQGAREWGFKPLDFRAFLRDRQPGNVFYYQQDDYIFDYRYFKDSITARVENDTSITLTFDRHRKQKYISGQETRDTTFIHRGLTRRYGKFYNTLEPGQYMAIPDSNAEYGPANATGLIGQVYVRQFYYDGDSTSYILGFGFDTHIGLIETDCELWEPAIDAPDFSYSFWPGRGPASYSYCGMNGCHGYKLVGFNIDGEQTGEEWYVSRAEKAARRPAFRLFPNPANDRLNIVFDQPASGPATYAVRDLAGRTALSGELAGEMLDVAELSSGAYLLEIRRGGERTTEKFIIAR